MLLPQAGHDVGNRRLYQPLTKRSAIGALFEAENKHDLECFVNVRASENAEMLRYVIYGPRFPSPGDQHEGKSSPDCSDDLCSCSDGPVLALTGSGGM